MPRAQQKKIASTATKSAPDINDQFGADDDVDGESQHSSLNDATPITSKGKKRNFVVGEEDPSGGGDFGNEMQKMLECFGADISKTLIAKRKRLEQYTQGTLKTTNRKVDDIWKNQQTERQKLHEEFRRQVTGVFTQWESDVDKTKEQEEKLTALFRQQQKLFQQTRIVQGQRLKTLKQLHEEYVKGLSNLEKCHSDQQGSVAGELKKEMAMLQKKILMDTQQQEMASVRKSLQTMLF